jgi:hypothetical protein
MIIITTREKREVNKCDQLLTAYPTEIKKTQVLYTKIFCHLMNICTFNAHVLRENMDALQFKEDLTARINVRYHPGLTGTPPVKCLRTSNKKNHLCLVKREFPVYVPATN